MRLFQFYPTFYFKNKNHLLNFLYPLNVTFKSFLETEKCDYDPQTIENSP